MTSISAHYKALLIFDTPANISDDPEALEAHTKSLIDKYKTKTKDENVLCFFGKGLVIN